MARYKQITAYLIHVRDYKDSSLILEVFSKERGMTHILAKGLKKNKRLKNELHYFSLLCIQYFGQSQLKTLAHIDAIENIRFDSLLLQTSGLYLNELLRYSLIENEPALELFEQYKYTVQNFGQQKLTLLLRHFENSILKNNGFELDINDYTNVQEWLSFSESNGLALATKKTEKLCLVSDLRDFLSHEILESDCQKRINKFMHKAIDVCLAYRRIFSRELLKSLTKK